MATIAALVVSIKSFTIATSTAILEIDFDSIPAIVIVAIVGSHWDRW